LLLTGRLTLWIDLPAFIPNLTIVHLILRKRLICVYGKNKTRTVMLIWNPTVKANFNRIGIVQMLAKCHLDRRKNFLCSDELVKGPFSHRKFFS
jgi:hypothetical protein